MKKVGSIFILINILIFSSVYAKGSVEVGLDSIAIRYDAIPVKNPSDYSVTYKTYYLDKKKLNEKKSNKSMSLNQISKLSTAPLKTIKAIKSFVLKGAIKFDSDKTRDVQYRQPETYGTTVVIDGSISIWGKDQLSGKENSCSVSIKKSLVNYLIIKTAVDSLGARDLVVIFVDRETGLCAGVELS